MNGTERSHLEFVADTPQSINAFQCLAVASGLRMYARCGMMPNRAWTPKAMMATAERLTGKKFKARDYNGAADALRVMVAAS